MAEQGEERNTDDLSEEVSPYKLEEYRRKGKVAQSRELSGMLALIAMGSTIFVVGPGATESLETFTRYLFRVDIAARLNFANFDIVTSVLMRAMETIFDVSLPLVSVAFIIGILGSYSQIGSIFSTDPLNPDLNRINPINGLQRLFSMKQFYDAIRLILRASVVGVIAYFLVKDQVFESPRFLLTDASAVVDGYRNAGLIIFFTLCAVLMVFAGFDLWLQRWEYNKQLRLTKKEQKQEHKEHEGDPLVKARIRAVQREMNRKRMMEAVKTADVLITNPTHIAIAITYNAAEMEAPKVVAKGADFLAQKLKKIAADHGVPRVENVPLARTLYRVVNVNQYIPRDLFQAVAEVLAYVYRLKGKGGGI